MKSLTLHKSSAEIVNVFGVTAFRLRVEAIAPQGVGAEVFCYLRGPVNPYTGEAADVFQAVAGPVDMAEFPAGAPDNTTTFPFFRKNSVELDFRATSLAEEAWRIIQTDVRTLLHALTRLEELGDDESATLTDLD